MSGLRHAREGTHPSVRSREHLDPDAAELNCRTQTLGWDFPAERLATLPAI